MLPILLYLKVLLILLVLNFNPTLWSMMRIVAVLISVLLVVSVMMAVVAMIMVTMVVRVGRILAAAREKVPRH